MCGWSVEDLGLEGKPTWCEYVKLEGSAPFRQKVEAKRANIAFMVVGAALNSTRPELGRVEGLGKGNAPVEFQLDDMAVCVPSHEATATFHLSPILLLFSGWRYTRGRLPNSVFVLDDALCF